MSSVTDWRDAMPGPLAVAMSAGEWLPTRLHRFLARTLAERLLDGGARVIVNIPPRYGKSETLSHRLPVWYLNTYPGRRWIQTSYGAALAYDFSRKVRNSIASRPDLLRVRLAPDSTSVQSWNTDAGGGLVAAGVGGPITGRGAHVLSIDDPIKNWKEALSSNHRRGLRLWYSSTARTRLEGRGSVLVVMTRWHYDDFSGGLERQGGWEVIRIPAVAEEGDPLGRAPGEPLWPEKFDRDALLQTRDEVEEFVWAALYQQKPLREQGAFFRPREWMKVEGAVPSGATYCRRWDFAATEPKEGSEDPDWTAGVLMARYEGTFFVVDVIRVRTDPASVEELVRSTAVLDRARAARQGGHYMVRWEEEGGASGKSLTAHYRDRVLVGYDAEGRRSTGDKTLRARPVAAAMKAGNILLLEGPWVEDYLRELEVFPAGDHDDQVDGTSGAFEDLVGDFPEPEVR